MITSCIVAPRVSAKTIKASLEAEGKNVCWITISGFRSKGLVIGSSKHILSMFFDDVVHPSFGASHNKARKIKNFILNHHFNSKHEWVLLVNCIAGISRSAAVGMFVQNNLGVSTTFIESCHPNKLLLQRLGVKQ